MATFTLTGSWINGDNTPATGTVRLGWRFPHRATGVILSTSLLEKKLANGAISVTVPLPAGLNTDPLLRVDVLLDNAEPDIRYYAIGRGTAGTVDLSSLAVVDQPQGWLVNLADLTRGEDGRGVVDLDATDGRLLVTFTDGTTTDAGPLPPSNVPGPIGQTGQQGAKGDTGDTGPQGPTGATTLNGVELPIQVAGAFNGTTDDTAAWNTATAAAVAAGGGTVVGRAGSVSSIKRSNEASQIQGGVQVGSNTVLDGAGGRLKLAGNCDMINVRGTTGSSTTVTADTTTSTTNLTVTSSAGFVVGNDVLVRLGQAAYDTDQVEPDFWCFAKVTAVPDGTHVTIDRPTGYAMTVSATTADRRTLQVVDLVENVTIQNFDLYNPMSDGASAESGIRIIYARNVHVENVRGVNTGAGMVVTQYAENITGSVIDIEESNNQNGQASFGRCFSFAETRNLNFTGVHGSRFEGTFAMIEATSTGIVLDGVSIDNNHPDRPSDAQLFACLGKSQVEVRHPVFAGKPGTLVLQTPENGDIEFTHPVFRTAGQPYIDKLGDVAGSIRVGETRYGVIRVYRKSLRLTPSGFPLVRLPSGLIRTIRVFVSTTTGVTYAYAASAAGSSGPFHGMLVAGQTIDVGALPSGIHGLGPSYLANAADGGKQIVFSTDGTVPAGAYALVEVEMFQSLVDDGSSAGGDVGDMTLLRDKDGGVGQLYMDNGVLKFRGAFGTVTTIANS